MVTSAAVNAENRIACGGIELLRRSGGCIGSGDRTLATEGGAALVFDPTFLVVGHITFAAHNNIIGGQKWGSAVGANFPDIIIHWLEHLLPWIL